MKHATMVVMAPVEKILRIDQALQHIENRIRIEIPQHATGMSSADLRVAILLSMVESIAEHPHLLESLRKTPPNAPMG